MATATKKAKKRYHHGDLRRALIDAALSLVDEGGIAKLTLREAARVAGVSHGAPYRHFEDKDALLAAIGCEGFEKLTAALESAAASATDEVERFDAQGLAYIEFALAHEAHYRVMFGSAIACQPGRWPQLDEAGLRAFSVLLEAVGRAQQNDLIRADLDEMQVATMLWSNVHGFATLVLDGQLPLERAQIEGVAKLTAQTFRRGLKAAE